MFNSPILDVAIGLVFIFLLYSLLATSINEFIATTLALRARMLKKAIAERMLSNTSRENKIINFFIGILQFFEEIIYLVVGRPQKKGNEKNIGDQFYSHPMIKNYGSNSYFKTPSYLAASNFAIILTEVLKEDFNNKLREIAFQKNNSDKPLQEIIDELSNSSDIVKIKELFDYYAWYYAVNPQTKIFSGLPDLPRGLDKETHCILQLHLRNSLFDFNEFTRKIEGWYNDTMDRVSGWYKRQTQFILFFLGIVLAIAFNVDTIDITNKLSTDKDARDQIVQLAIQSSAQLQNDARVQRNNPANNTDTSQNQLYALSQKRLDEAKNTLDSSIKNPNLIMGMGWGKYGEDNPAFIRSLLNKHWYKFLFWRRINFRDSLDTISKAVDHELDSIQEVKKSFQTKSDTATTPGRKPSVGPAMPQAVNIAAHIDSINRDSLKLVRFFDKQRSHFPVRIKTAYIRSTIGPKKFLGFLLTAFAISLGAPFWFDLLNKLVKLRGAGKKDDSSNSTELTATKPSVPVITNNINTQTASEEAVG